MKIGSYEVFIEKGKWVEEKRLVALFKHNGLQDDLERLVAHPDYPSYRQSGNLAPFKRIHCPFNQVVYCRLHEAAQILVILAAVNTRDVKVEESGRGLLKTEFSNYLLSHKTFLSGRFVSFDLPEVSEPKPEPIPVEHPEIYTEPIVAPRLDWTFHVLIKPLTENECVHLLVTLHGHAPADPYCLDILTRTENSTPGDRILVTLPPGGENWEKEKIKALQREIVRTLKFYQKRYSVRFDPFARKFLLVPPGMEKVYCAETRGRQMSVN